MSGARQSTQGRSQIPAPSHQGRAFYGTRSLDLLVIARVAACVILCAIATGLTLIVLSHLGLLHKGQEIAGPVLILAITASALATLVTTSIALHRVLKPIRELRGAMERVTQGDFSARVDDEGANNELGSLLRSFNTMADELGSIEMLRDEFVDDFSHELKTPITSIRGFARQIERNPEATQRDREYAGIIVTEANRLIVMSSNVLALNRFESQQVVVDARDYALDEQLRRCALMLQDRWEARGIELDLDSVRPTTVRASEEMLAQVWLNVLDNAIKYSPDGSTVHVSCENVWPDEVGGTAAGGNGIARVSVRDEGPGMDEETLRRAFDKFYRGSATAGTAGGNGLGLPIVRRIVELARGTISVRTEPGHGTDFTVTLPASR
ncbi:MAG: HAMP domain-containing histidine kinase [Coriobacteriia bacterium]|nr:HAMP domain-containing histidine kinase [Coriobacteriia bacterium]MBS5477172.1 HAMP domain-containing histidine kinase [Coriobacteriia bacterium]